MFYYFAKVAGFFLNPSTALLLLLLLGTVLLWSRWARGARRLVAVSALLLLVAGLSPLGHALMLPLENRFPRSEIAQGQSIDGVVVLGGAQDMSNTLRRGAPALNEASERLLEAAALAWRYPEARILFTGGSNAVFGDRQSEASGARQVLQALGVEPGRLLLEDRSRNTYQNAQYSLALAKPENGQRWLLVTSAGHMPRAMGCFRKAGFQVQPWPVDYRTRGREDLVRFFSKASEGWRRVDMAVREWIGLVIYRVTGRTNTLFPAP